MLQWINDRFKHFGWILLAPLALSFALWGVHGLVDFSSKLDKGLKVNGEELSVDALRNSYQDQVTQLHRMIPDGEIPASLLEGARRSLLDRYVGAALLNQQVTKQHFVVTDQQVVESIREIPAFQVGGHFDRDAYEGLLRQQGLSPQRFEAEERQSLRSRQLEGGLVVSAFVTPQEFNRTIALEKESRDAGYVLIPQAKYLAQMNPDAAALSAYYNAHKQDFLTPDTVSVDYVELTLDSVTAGVTVTDEALRGYYDQLKDRYVEPEKRRARHILIQSGTDDAKAKARAEELYKQASAANADFAALAKANSQDTVSAAEGGDLGWAEKTFFVAPFADALFAMKTGEIHPPVKTQFGWHIIKLDGVQEGHQKSFDEVRATLEPEFRRNEAEKLFGEQQEKIDTLAFENAGSLEPLAKALKLNVKSIADFTRANGGPGLPADPKVVAAAFSTDVLAGQNSRAIEIKPGDVVVLRASNHRAPTEQTEASVHDQVLAQVKLQMAAKAAQSAAQALMGSLSQGMPLAQAIASLGSTQGVDVSPAAPSLVRYQPIKSLGRREKGVPTALIEALFKAPAPAVGKTGSGVVALGDTVGVYSLLAVKPGVVDDKDGTDMRPVMRAQGSSEVAAYIATLKAKSDIKIDPKLFD